MTLDYTTVDVTSTSTSVERAYFVDTAEIMSGAYPYAEPVVLLHPAQADQHPFSRALEVVETPASEQQAPASHAALPLFVVAMDVAWQYEAARPAVIVRDLRR
jgi:hypothetical protein